MYHLATQITIFFPSIDIGDVNVKETFIHGGSRINNPVKALLEEAVSIFPGQRTSCVLSISSGAQGTTGFEARATSLSTELARVLKKVIGNGESISDQIAKELSDKEVFLLLLPAERGLRTSTYRLWRKYLHTLVPGQSWSGTISKYTWVRVVRPSKAATETLNVQCALLQDTLESCMQGQSFPDLPDELKGSIGQLLEELKKMFEGSAGQEDPMMLINTGPESLRIVLHDILKYVQKDDTMKKAFTRLEQHAMN